MKRFSGLYMMCFTLSLMATPLLWEPDAFAQDLDTTVPDEKLAAVVREALELDATDPITPRELATLTSLDGSSRGIVDLTGLEHATRLTRLGLWGNSISNVAPLARLTHLKSLYLSANSISDLRPLARLTHLRTLVLNDNFISNVAPLAHLRNLRQLYLAGNSINNLHPLTGLANLSVLYLHTNSISDLHPLAHLTHLSVLGLWDNSIVDVTPLTGLTRLTRLYLHANSIRDLHPLAGLTSLRTLDLSDNSITDVAPLAGLTHLKELGLWDNLTAETVLHEQLHAAGLRVERVPRTTSHPLEVTHRRRRLGTPCPVGWKRQDSFGTPTRRVIVRAIEVEIEKNNRSGIYKPVAIEIYADPTENLSDLHGWRLALAVLYNHPTDYLLTTENATFNEDGIARIESPSDTPFPMKDADYGGQVLPSFDYRLFDENNVRVDFAIACYKEPGLTARLQAMASPRVERNIVIARLDWKDNYYRSEWRVGAPTAPAAPTALRRVLTTSWAALKKKIKD